MSSKNGAGWPGRSAELVAGLELAGPGPDWQELPGRLRARMFNAVPNGPVAERPITVDQTHLSVVVGERLVVKWMRQPVPNDRAIDLLAHLAAVGFPAIPIPYAVIVRDGPLACPEEVVALVTGYLPDARDGWDWCVEAVVAHLRGTGPADIAAGLGDLTAQLHAALATPSAVFPDPVGWAAQPTWQHTGLGVLAQALELTGGAGGDIDGGWLAEHADAIRADLAPAGEVDRAWTMPVHGDLHVGQILRWRDGDAVTDFDGNPAVSAAAGREPAARDVAQMRTSLAHVGQVAHRRTEAHYAAQVDQWVNRATGDFLAAYQRGLAAHGVGQLFDERLLRPFEVEQECRELVYAERFLPRWRYAPMGVLRSWYG